MKKIILLLILAGPAAVFFESCAPDCNCPKVSTYFKTDKIETDVLEYNGPQNIKVVNDSGTVQNGTLAVRINSDLSYYGKADFKPSFSLINSAYACNCLYDGYGGTTRKLKAINIISLSAFNSNFGTGDTLNSIAVIDGLPIATFIKNYNNGVYLQGSDIIQFSQTADYEIWHKLLVEFDYGTYSLKDETVHFIIKP